MNYRNIDMIKFFKYFFLLIILSITLKAQSITGRVSDFRTTQFLSDVSVVIKNLDTGDNDTVLTDHLGSWSYTITGINDLDIIHTFMLSNNYPNPFNPSTTFNFDLPQTSNIIISVHDVLGRRVDQKKFNLSSGSYLIDYEGKGAAGIYFYTIQAGENVITKKMIQLDGGNGKGLCNLRLSNNFRTSLRKTTTSEIQIVYSKFGYVNDTLFSTITDNAYFETTLETLHSNSTVVDLHNDILERVFMEDPNYHLGDFHTKFETDIPRLKLGHVDLQFFAVWVSPTAYTGQYYSKSLEMMDHIKYEAMLNPDELVINTNFQSSLNTIDNGKISGVIGVEGGHSIENSIEKLNVLYENGMRYLTITWNNSTDWAISAQDSRSQTVGLSDFGKEVIRTLDSLGIIIDVSHTGIKTINDILEISNNPIVATHSGARAVTDHYRNLYDYQIEDIANSGGVIGIVFYPPFIGDPNHDGVTDIADVIAHIDYIVNLVGIDYVSLGSDFDGTGGNLPVGLDDVSKLPALTIALLEHGYSQMEVRKILGENFLRVYKKVCN